MNILLIKNQKREREKPIPRPPKQPERKTPIPAPEPPIKREWEGKPERKPPRRDPGETEHD